jgi:membrane protease YdiL (CAAX protease family)
MYDTNSKGISYTAGFFMLIAFAIAGLIFASMIAGQVWVSMTGKTIEALSSGKFEPSDSWAYKIIQGISQVFGYFLPTLIVAITLNRKPLQLIGYEWGFKWSQAGMVALIIIIALIASGGLSYVTRIIPIPEVWRILFTKMEADYVKQVAAIINLNTPQDLIISLVFMAVIPAICEETLFRGGLQNFLTRSTKRPWVSIIIVSLIFSAVHFSYYGFLSRFFLGIILGCLYHYSGRMWSNILLHFLNNALALTVLYITQQDGKPVSQAMTETDSGWWGLLAFPLVIGLLIYFKKISASSREAAV